MSEGPKIGEPYNAVTLVPQISGRAFITGFNRVLKLTSYQYQGILTEGQGSGQLANCTESFLLVSYAINKSLYYFIKLITSLLKA